MTNTTIAIIGNQGFSLLNFRGPLIEDLVRSGYRVIALAPDMDEASAKGLHSLGAEPVSIWLSRTGVNPLADFLALLLLFLKLVEIRPDVTLSYAAKPAIYGTLAAWFARVPRRYAMIEGLGNVFIEQPREKVRKKLLRRFVANLYKSALKRADKVFFLNPDDICDFASRRLVSLVQVVRINGIGVDLSTWRSLPAFTETITFTFVGRLLRDKGILDFAAAARVVKNSAPQVRFLILGDLDSNPDAISLSEVRGWVEEGIVEWPGHVPVRDHLARTSVFVLPSRREGVPRSTQEAMASAKPVITTDAPGCRETVIHGQNGFLVPPGDVVALASAMQHFIENPVLIASMGAASRRLAEERFDVRKTNARISRTMGL